MNLPKLGVLAGIDAGVVVATVAGQFKRGHPMRTYSLSLLAMVLLSGCGQSPQLATPQPPRFEIHDTIIDESLSSQTDIRSESKHVLIKLDNQTGQTWEYVSRFHTDATGSTMLEGWKEIPSSVETSHSN